MKSLIDELDRAQYILSEVRDNINKVFRDTRENQYALSSNKWGIDVNVSEILDINLGVGHDVRNQLHPDPDQGDGVGGSLQREAVQDTDEGKEW